MATVYSAIDHSPIILEELDGRTLVVTVPAAFSPTCTEECVPGILQYVEKIKDAGITTIVVVTADQPFAIQNWIESEGWQDSDVVFASDFGDFELQELVGKLSDENDKAGAPPILGNLLRRSYNIFKDGDIEWEFTEPDSGSYTLDIEALLEAATELSED